jgi:outer membrane protein assembly factor BamB
MDAQLAIIQNAIQSGKVGGDELAHTAYLMEIAGEMPGPGASQTQLAVQVQYRVRALRLLAYIGSRETLHFLTNLFTKDNEVLIKAAAADAIGSIGLDPEGIALRSFTAALLSGPATREEQLQLAIASATASLCRFSGPPLSDTGVKILTSLMTDNRAPIVRQRARQELATLSP